MYNNLDKAIKPWVLNSNLDLDKFLISTSNDSDIRENLFILNGKSMKTWVELFNEFSKIMSFPKYFGHNRDAFDECMIDLYEFLDNKIFILFIEHSEYLLVNEKDKNSLKELIEDFNDYAEELSNNIFDDENNQNIYPLHVILSNQNRTKKSY